jgi:hypothetical protein
VETHAPCTGKVKDHAVSVLQKLSGALQDKAVTSATQWRHGSKAARGALMNPPASPPTPPVLHVAVTGHRPNRLSAARMAQMQPKLHQVLGGLANAMRRLHAPAPVDLVLSSALAEGADRQLATLGLELGYALHALLPFAPPQYRTRFFGDAASCAEFDTLLQQAERVDTLPPQPDGDDGSVYARLGHQLLDRADVLLAVWDGRDAQGLGGTADVVRGALLRQIPVLHLCSRTRRAPMLLWHTERPAAQRPGPAPCSCPCDSSALEAMLARKLLRAGGCA